MLVLSRKPNETIRIGDNIELKVIEIKGDTVRLGIEAPKDLEILRGELLLSISESNNEAISIDNSLFTKLTRKS